MSMLKQPRYENEPYLAWIRTLPSVLSGHGPCVAHHLHGHMQGGTGTKAPDYYAFPLTNEEHTYLHNYGWRQWEAEHDSQWRYVAQTMGQAIREGILRD